MDCNHVDDVAMEVLATFARSPIERVTILKCINNEIVVAQSGSGNDHAARQVAFVVDGKLLAIVHNHPGTDRMSIFFSDVDKAQARRKGVPSYITNTAGVMRKFDPIENVTTELN